MPCLGISQVPQAHPGGVLRITHKEGNSPRVDFIGVKQGMCYSGGYDEEWERPGCSWTGDWKALGQNAARVSPRPLPPSSHLSSSLLRGLKLWGHGQLWVPEKGEKLTFFPPSSAVFRLGVRSVTGSGRKKPKTEPPTSGAFWPCRSYSHSAELGSAFRSTLAGSQPQSCQNFLRPHFL